MKSPTKAAAAAAAAAAATATAPTPAPEVSADSWRCKGCGVFNADPNAKACGGCKKQRPREDIEKAAQAFPMLKKVGTEVVDRLEAYTGGEYPISQEDRGKIDMAKKLQRHIDALKADDLGDSVCAKALEEQLQAIKLPDVVNKALVDKKDLDARLLEIEQKAATARSQLAAALLKIDQREQDEVSTLEKEIAAWKNEFEAKSAIARKDRVAAKERNAVDRTAILKTEEVRAAEQLKLTTETQSSLRKAASAHPPSIASALRAGGGNPAQALARPDPPEAAILTYYGYYGRPPAVRCERRPLHRYTGRGGSLRKLYDGLNAPEGERNPVTGRQHGGNRRRGIF